MCVLRVRQVSPVGKSATTRGRRPMVSLQRGILYGALPTARMDLVSYIYIYIERERERRERERARARGGEGERIWFTHARAHARAHSHLKTPPASACSFNDFKPEGATALAPALQQLTTLHKLILGSAASLLPSSSLEAPDSSVRGPPSRFLRFDHETGRLRGRVILRGESGLGSLGLPETWNTATRRCGLYISPSI